MFLVVEHPETAMITIRADSADSMLLMILFVINNIVGRAKIIKM